MGAEVIRAKDADEVGTLHARVRDMLAVDAHATEDALARQVTEALTAHPNPSRHLPARISTTLGS